MTKTYTIADLVRILRVAPITVKEWRNGSKRRTPLPCTTQRIGPGRSQVRVTFDAAVLRDWLYKNRADLLFRLDIEEKPHDVLKLPIA